ncbi:FecR domain-containing protein [Magnetospirillum aberrantis]|uniref:FecR protein domain-containing protein n=1 Tax=Magnetospirillum aberrantis SpK TaxID=908842 RepID=A0A7C9V168_9PROT|nr:hypothetical protein [Magnetospirillum aberrantis SpK]
MTHLAMSTQDSPPTADELRTEAVRRFVSATSGDAPERERDDLARWAAGDNRRQHEISCLERIDADAAALTAHYPLAAPVRSRRWHWAAAMGMAMAGACIILLLPPKVIDAAIRPQQVTLGDGSRIDLDAGTVVKIPRQPWAHSITLVKGDAVFDVVHDESRPFTVHTPITTITDVGTRFLVRSRPDSSTVAVFEGEVAVTPPQGPAQRLTAQQAVEIRASGATKTLAPMNERGETAWRQGRIVFKDTPLSEVAARLSRYSPRPVLMGTPTLAGLKVSGSFAIDNGDDALGALEQVLPIRARRLDDRIVLEPVGRTQPPTRTPR